MTTATEIITDAYERLNRLSPGESLNADDAAYGLRRLNLLVDELAVKQPFLYKSVLTTVAQTGNVTLGAGSWTAISPGDNIISVTQDDLPLAPITMKQYNEQYDVTTSGAPNVWAYDGLSTVYFIPVPNGQDIKIMTRTGVAEFADLTTSYTLPEGYENYLGAALAVRCAPALLGRVPPELIRAETMAKPYSYQPQVLNAYSYTSPTHNSRHIENGG